MLSLWMSLAWGASLSLSPMELEVDAPAGSVVTTTVRVTNTDTRRAEIKLYLQDWWYEDSGAHRIEPVGTLDTSAAVFSDIPQERIVLAPGETEEVSIRVRPPGSSSGGRYMVVFAQTNTGRAAMRVGSLVLVDTGDTTPSRFSVGEARFVADKDGQRLLIPTTHTGNIHAHGTLKGVITRNEGGMVERNESKPVRFLPGQAREVPFVIQAPLSPGVYTFTGVLTDDNSSPAKVTSHFVVR